MVGIHILQNGLIQRQQLVDGSGVRPQVDDRLRRGDAQLHAAGGVLRQLCHKGAHLRGVPVTGGFALGPEADLVAEGHLHHGLGQAVLHGPGGPDLAGLAQGVELLPDCL